MLKNYLKIAVRNLLRYKAYSFINIFGLAIGIACCLLIMLYINDELSYDRFHQNADRIFRINTDLKFGNTELAIPECSDMMAPLLKKDYPQVEEYVRIYNWVGTKIIKKDREFYNEQKSAYVDSTFFQVFTFPLISGDKNNVLNEPNTVVISESMAKKYFGTTDAFGKYLETNDNGSTVYRVTAVMKDMPTNSHFYYDFLFPMKNLNYNWGNLVSMNFHTYLLLRKGTDYKEFEKKFIEYNIKYAFPYAKEFMNIPSMEAFEKAGNKLVHTMTPLTDIHLYSKRAQEISPSGNIQYVYIFAAVALFILLIACINFMNLTTARSANRVREVGIRKVLGTQRSNLVFQFLSEATLMAFISVVLAVLIVYNILPFFSSVSGKDLSIDNLFSLTILPLLLLLPVIIGFAAGCYPAFFLSRFMPVEVIKGKISAGSKRGGLRSALVVFQFATSIILITGTLIIYNQLNFIQNKNLGYSKDQVLIIDEAYSLGENIDAFKNEMLNVLGVSSATISGFLPVPSQRNFNAFFREATGSGPAENGLTMQSWEIDEDYFKTIGIELKEGRNFSKEFGSDNSAVILNETAVKQLGYKDPVGQKLFTVFRNGGTTSYDIIGVVKNFHFESLHQEIGAMCFRFERNSGRVSLKVNAANIPQIIREAESKWKEMSQGKPFGYRFMDESFNDVYKAEQRIGMIALCFSILAILVACLGLFGLATFLAEQRTKEIGVRKVLGASVPSIIAMLSKEFLKWVLIANIIAWPISYYFMNQWLQDFAYRININIWIFIISGTAAVIIALATVSYQAVKAAIADPVKSLRYE